MLDAPPDVLAQLNTLIPNGIILEQAGAWKEASDTHAACCNLVDKLKAYLLREQARCTLEGMSSIKPSEWGAEFTKAHELLQNSLAVHRSTEASELLGRTHIAWANAGHSEGEIRCLQYLHAIMREYPNDSFPLHLLAEFFQTMGAPARALPYKLLALHMEERAANDSAARERLAAQIAGIRSELLSLQRIPQDPHVIFKTVPYCGSSAIDPILREYLTKTCRYDALGSNHLSRFADRFLEGARPLYVWTHDSQAQFPLLLKEERTRVLFLYRDPRDALISRIKDYMSMNFFPGLSEREYYERLLPEAEKDLADGLEWFRLDDCRCFKLSFEEMKKDVGAAARRILAFLGLPLFDLILDQLVEKYSYKKMAQRDEGTDGKVIKHMYLFRKGVPGEWRCAFDEDLKRLFKSRCNRFLIEYGYESGDDW